MGSLISVDHNSRSIEAVAPVLTRNLQHKQHIILFARPGRAGQGSPRLYRVSFNGGTNWLHEYGSDTSVVDSYSILQVDKDPVDPTSLRLWSPAINGSDGWLALDAKSRLFFTKKESEGTLWRFGGMSLKAASLVNVRKGGSSFLVRMQPVLRSWYEREGLFWEPEEMAGFHLAPDALRGLCPVFERRLVHFALQREKAGDKSPARKSAK